MSQQDVDTLRRAYEAFNRGDVPAVLQVFDAQMEWHEPGGGRAPRGTFRGPQSVGDDVFATVPQNFEEFQATPEQFIDAGEHVVVVGRFRGRSKSGQQMDLPFVHVFGMRSGRATSFHNYPEAAPWARAWGG
jgi:ketosteroid isomerase-like protein